MYNFFKFIATNIAQTGQDIRFTLGKTNFLVEYEDARKKSGYNVYLNYTKSEKKQRESETISHLILPFVNRFQQTLPRHLLTKRFLTIRKLSKVFSHNTVKVSCGCMSNMSEIIKGHDKKVTAKPPDQMPKCSCRKKKKRMSSGRELLR